MVKSEGGNETLPPPHEPQNDVPLLKTWQEFLAIQDSIVF